jgi:hypothetical protein
MKYLAMIYGDESVWDTFSEEQKEAAYARYGAFYDAASAAGVVLGGNELGPTRDATTVRVREADTIVTDGPYAEVKEALGGFFLLECSSMDEALDWAARIPGAEHGAVEVRPLYVDPSAEGAEA